MQSVIRSSMAPFVTCHLVTIRHATHSLSMVAVHHLRVPDSRIPSTDCVTVGADCQLFDGSFARATMAQMRRYLCFREDSCRSEIHLEHSRQAIVVFANVTVVLVDLQHSNTVRFTPEKIRQDVVTSEDITVRNLSRPGSLAPQACTLSTSVTMSSRYRITFHTSIRPLISACWFSASG